MNREQALKQARSEVTLRKAFISDGWVVDFNAYLTEPGLREGRMIRLDSWHKVKADAQKRAVAATVTLALHYMGYSPRDRNRVPLRDLYKDTKPRSNRAVLAAAIAYLNEKGVPDPTDRMLGVPLYGRRMEASP